MFGTTISTCRERRQQHYDGVLMAVKNRLFLAMARTSARAIVLT